MRTFLITTAICLGLSMLTISVGRSATIECSAIGSQFDDLFTQANKRVTDYTAELKALPERKKLQIHPKICLAAGEVMGLLKLLRAVNDDCTKKGHDTAKFTNVINEQFKEAEPIYKSFCGA